MFLGCQVNSLAPRRCERYIEYMFLKHNLVINVIIFCEITLRWLQSGNKALPEPMFTKSYVAITWGQGVNTLGLRQNGSHFADDTFRCIFLNENEWTWLKNSLKFPKVWIKNIPALVQIMAWRWPGDKLLSEAIMVCLLTHIWVTQPQWVNYFSSLDLLLTSSSSG